MVDISDARMKGDLERYLARLPAILAEIRGEGARVPRDSAAAGVILNVLRLRADRTEPRHVFWQRRRYFCARDGARGIADGPDNGVCRRGLRFWRERA